MMTNSIDIGNSNPQELADVIAELQEYRDRLLNDTLDAAKKAKMQKAAVMAQLEPELTQIDAILASLAEQKAALEAAN